MHDTSRLHSNHVDAPVGVDSGSRAVALGVLCLCAFTTAVDITITNVALPFISTELDASTTDLQWVIDSYNIVLAGMVVLGGGIADRIGRRTVFLGSYTLFGVACVLAALSTSAEMLIAARALMGLAAAGVVAPALAIIATLYEPARRARAIAAWAVFGAAGLAVGPVIGGLLLAHFWWGSVFLVNVPIVVVGVLIGVRTTPQSRGPERGRLDVSGAMLSVFGLGALLFGLIEGPERGWSTPGVIGGLVVGVAAMMLFVRRELRVRSPLFDVRILSRPAVAAGSITLFVAYIVFTGMLFLVPQYLQDVRGESIISVGLLLVPFAVVFGIASTRSGPVMVRLGARTTIAVGLAVCALGMMLLAVAVDDALVLTIAASTVVGVGLSALIAPASTVVMNALPPAKAGDGSSFNMVSRFVGAAVGVAAVGSVFASGYASRLTDGVGSLTPAQAATSQGSIQGALGVARQLGPARGGFLVTDARHAFNAAAGAGYLVVAALAALASAWAAWALRDRVSPP